MSTPPLTHVASVSRSRTVVVTVIAWIIIVLSAIITPISFISLLMILAGSYGTSTSDPIGFLTVVIAPPATLLAGIGLLFRKRWAYVYMLVLLSLVLAYNAYQMTRPTLPPRTFTSPTGVKTTVLSSGGNYSLPLMAVCAGLLITLLLPRIRGEFSRARPVLGSVPGEMPRAQLQPASNVAAPRASTPSVRNRDDPEEHSARWKRLGASLLALAILLGIAGYTGWTVTNGLATGETKLPSKMSSQRRIVSRAQEPAMFWASIGIYATVALGTFGLAVWGVTVSLKKPKGGHSLR